MRPVLAVTVLILATLSHLRSLEWNSEERLWASAVRTGPLMPRSHLCLGLAHKDRQDWIAAHEAFARCRDLSMEQHNAGLASRCWNNLGSLSLTLGQLDLAEMAYSQSLLLVPGYPDAMANMASVWLERGDTAAAIKGYREVLEMLPWHAQTWTNLSLALAGRDSAGAAAATAKAEKLR